MTVTRIAAVLVRLQVQQPEIPSCRYRLQSAWKGVLHERCSINLLINIFCDFSFLVLVSVWRPTSAGNFDDRQQLNGAQNTSKQGVF